MPAKEALAAVGLKIKRANKHIGDLDITIRAFFDTKPYKMDAKRNPQTRQLIYYLTSVDPVPSDIAVIAGDALHNMRSALDNLAQQLYLFATGSSGYGDQTGFPIGKSAKDFRAGLGRKVHGMRQDAVDMIRALEPYKGGKGQDLWTLHSLNNIDKHRLIVTVGSAFQSVNVGAVMMDHVRKNFSHKFPGGVPDVKFYFAPADNLFPLKAGDELFIDGPDAKINEKMDFRFHVAVNEPGVIEGKPLLDTLLHFSNIVSLTVASFEPCFW